MSATNGNRLHEEPIAMRKNIGELGSDLIALGELQMQLVQADSKEVLQKSITPIILMTVAAGLLIGALPLALVALAWWLDASTQLNFAASGGIVAGVAAVIAAILILSGVKSLKENVKILDRSRYELRNNIQWIKRVMSSETERKDCSTYY